MHTWEMKVPISEAKERGRDWTHRLQSWCLELRADEKMTWEGEERAEWAEIPEGVTTQGAERGQRSREVGGILWVRKPAGGNAHRERGQPTAVLRVKQGKDALEEMTAHLGPNWPLGTESKEEMKEQV